MSDKLKPCPFCGGDASLTCVDNTYMVGCEICNIHTPSIIWHSKNKCIEAWNKRTKTIDEPEFKLISLKDKPATEKDTGKTIYSMRHHYDCPMTVYEWEITEVFKTGDLRLICNKFKTELIQFNRLKHFYWQKPVIVAEQALNKKV